LVLLVVLTGLLSFLLISRKDIDATIMRTPGMLYQERGSDSVSNLYNIKVVNKTLNDVPLNIRMMEQQGKIELIGGHDIIVKNEGQGSGSFFVILPREVVTERKLSIALGLYQGDNLIDVIETNFLGPVSD